jgi:hypothetical protein
MNEHEAPDGSLQDFEWPITEESVDRLFRQAQPPPLSTIEEVLVGFEQTAAHRRHLADVDLQAPAGAARDEALTRLTSRARDLGLHVIHIERLDAAHDAMLFGDLQPAGGSEPMIYPLMEALEVIARSIDHPGMVVVIDDVDHAELEVWWAAMQGVQHARTHRPVWVITAREPGPLSALPTDIMSRLVGVRHKVVVA